MFTWIDGHLLLALLVCVPLAYIAVCAINGHLRNRAERRDA